MINRILNRILRVHRKVLYSNGLDNLLYSSEPKKNSSIILFHGIDTIGKTDFNLRFCSLNDFKKQLLYLKKHFVIVPVKEIFNTDSYSGKTKIAITFDDGYLNNFKYALPVLEELEIPASFYITSVTNYGITSLFHDDIDICSSLLKSFEYENIKFTRINNQPRLFSSELNIDINEFARRLEMGQRDKLIKAIKEAVGFDYKTKEDLEDYWELIGERELKLISNSKNITIGSHSCFHNDLTLIDVASAKKELLDSKNYLENVTGKSVTELSYPFGTYTRELIDYANSIGYKYQLACDYIYLQDKDDQRILDRFEFYSDISYIEQLHRFNLYLRQ